MVSSPSGPFTGTMRKWKHPWGFVVCDDFEGDLFAHKDNFLSDAPGDLTGATVQFERHQDARGRMTATNIRVLSGQRRGGGAGFAAYMPMAQPRQVMAAARLPAWSYPAATAWSYPAATGVQRLYPQVGDRPSTRADPARLQLVVGQRLRGEIRKWKQDWGFVVCPARFEGDVFAHRDSIHFAGEPCDGMKVCFVVAEVQGRLAATEITESAAAAEDLVGHPGLVGHIRSWKQDWGFIAAPDFFDGDLFCHADELLLDERPSTNYDGLKEICNQRQVSFEIMVDKRGRVCAHNVALGDALDPVDAIPSHKPVAQVVPLWPRPVRAQPRRAVQVQPSEHGEFLTGTLRTWREPWGFVVCPEAFEGDLFCHRDNMAPGAVEPQQGSTVRFRREQDHRGRWCAQKVQVLPGAGAAPGETLQAAVRFEPRRPAAAPSWAAAAGPRGGKGAPKAGDPSKLDEKFQLLLGQTLFGQIRSWKDVWGFVVSPETFEGDLFCHSDNLVGGMTAMAVGAQITFEVEADPRGRATARRVTCINESADWVDHPEPLTGVVATLSGGEGTLASPGAFTDELSFTVESCGAADVHSLRVGLEVSFLVGQDAEGRPMAIDMKVAGGAKRFAGGFPAPAAKRVRL